MKIENNMNEDILNSVRSWSFPPEFSPDIQPTRLVSSKENIKQSLQILFSTLRGERVHRPEYGFPFREMVFETNTLSTQVRVKDSIKQAVARFEPRVRLEEIIINELKAQDGIWEILLTYTIIQSGENDSLTYAWDNI